jgi:hypothetical protein
MTVTRVEDSKSASGCKPVRAIELDYSARSLHHGKPPCDISARGRCRVHRIPSPTFMTIAKRPSAGRDGAACTSVLGETRKDLFSRTGLDDPNHVDSEGEIFVLGISRKRLDRVILRALGPVRRSQNLLCLLMRFCARLGRQTLTRIAARSKNRSRRRDEVRPFKIAL